MSGSVDKEFLLIAALGTVGAGIAIVAVESDVSFSALAGVGAVVLVGAVIYDHLGANDHGGDR